MKLNLYLKQRGIITGPLSKRKNTSHSRLDVILKYLTNREQFHGGEGFLYFGSALHSLSLEGGTKLLQSVNIALPDRKRIMLMAAKLETNPVWKKLMLGAICELKKKTSLNGVRVSYILDILQKKLRRGADLKTTVCKTFEEFVQSAIDYGYFRQGETYKAAEKLKDFIFVGIQKVPPHNIYILDVSLYPEETKYAIQELEFLLYFYDNYGNVLKGGIDLRNKFATDNENHLMDAVRYLTPGIIKEKPTTGFFRKRRWKI